MDDPSQRWYDDYMLNESGSRVVVTGANGRTGLIVVRKLLELGCNPKYDIIPRAMVRNEESGALMKQQLGTWADSMYCSLEVVHGDVTKPESLKPVFEGAHFAIILTSAMPKVNKASLIPVIGAKVLTLGMASLKPTFWFEEGQSPEEVDWAGQRNQIDAARAAGVRHIILVSSMGGTQPNHFLNTHMENMVLWKRKAEQYLISSGVPYTIIHPGGLLPHFGNDDKTAAGGKRQLFLEVDDILLDDGRGHKTIPREDVAEICVQCLLEPQARGRSFDLGSGPEEEGEIYDGDFKTLLATLDGKSCRYDNTSLATQISASRQPFGCCGAEKQGRDSGYADAKVSLFTSDDGLKGA
mmetsp:Transcript_52120/g.93424  ORF Transcript_52120/g.93424 Transcript_52120/m.93424 type:complete len:354 (-) Transcript_52120:58-1119(-)|eukprot:CAMPEP_0197639028 /NCGR_PEP_ID=MMETSP1338-20131121/13774_1 /TAXON_ID=43686 ORGANISM="Pelagodinium beii, Strain RCC1491" /NCGR_SAMPLE_ID=MMETSP1338 /ASSEMBLY_ACC=CAM_ASM_000754 /LENGTH=353 /DNA_ID=CAMNT_0043211699 /DNA_START=27 /DNA_END=1088 /DNA_ORIENTATION=-